MAAPNLAWGGFSNGKIPLGNLVAYQSGKYLQADAAQTLRKLAQAFQSRWGEPIYLASYQDAYRDITRQTYMYQHPYEFNSKGQVAYPGTSIHGWGRSADLSGYGAGGSQRHSWLVQNAPGYGWSWDYGRQLGESWHFDYVGPITTTAGGGGLEPIEEEMNTAVLLRKVNGSIAYWNGPTFIPLSNTNQVNALAAANLVPNNSGTAVYMQLSDDLIWNMAQDIANMAASSDGFTAADRALLGDLPTNGEMGQALTSTVSLVNEHADANKGEILEAIGNIPGGSGGPSSVYGLSLTIDAVPGTATGTATPQ